MNHIAQLGRLSAKLEQQGFRVLAIGRSNDKSAQETAHAFAGQLELLNDPRLTVYQQYGFGRVAGVVQRSGTVVVDQNQVVRYFHCTLNPKKSLLKDELLQAVHSIA